MALEGLPGVLELRVALADDRFDVRYDPKRVTTDQMLEAVSALGYSPEIVTGVAPSEAPTERLDTAALPDVFAEAARENRPVLLDFFGPG